MANNDIGGVWRTVGGRRIFIKDGEDLKTAMKNSGKFENKKESEKPTILNNRKNLVDYIKWQLDIDLEKAATEKQYAPRRGLNIDSRKLTENEFNALKNKLLKEGIKFESNGVYDYFITYEKKEKESVKITSSSKKESTASKTTRDFSKMTRKELATLLVEDQIRRGILKPESKEKQINARLTGQFKMGHFDLIEYARKYLK